MSRPTLTRIENGHPRPELDVVLRVVAALDLVLDLVPAASPPIDLDAVIEGTTSFLPHGPLPVTTRRRRSGRGG